MTRGSQKGKKPSIHARAKGFQLRRKHDLPTRFQIDWEWWKMLITPRRSE